MTTADLIAQVDDLGDRVKELRAGVAALDVLPVGVLRALDDAHGLLVYAGNTLAGKTARARRG